MFWGYRIHIQFWAILNNMKWRETASSERKDVKNGSETNWCLSTNGDVHPLKKTRNWQTLLFPMEELSSGSHFGVPCKFEGASLVENSG
jgi:hypothetical protein